MTDSMQPIAIAVIGIAIPAIYTIAVHLWARTSSGGPSPEIQALLDRLLPALHEASPNRPDTLKHPLPK
jgi:hypothetical protein